jgi:hypothetical protein
LLLFSDGVPVWEFTGIVIGPSESDEHARILTSSDTVCDYDGKLLDRKVYKVTDMHVWFIYLFAIIRPANMLVITTCQ